MGEFVFKNLSVKLLPAEGDAPQGDGRDCACCSYVVGCNGATDAGCGCTRSPCTESPTCRGCTNNPCTNGPTCGQCTNDVTCGICTRGDSMSGCSSCSCAGTIDIVSEPEFDVKRTGDIRSELAAHKERLRQAIAQVEDEERKLETRGKPQSIEEIDQLKTQFLDAIAELDAQRGRLATGEEPPPA